MANNCFNYLTTSKPSSFLDNILSTHNWKDGYLFPVAGRAIFDLERDTDGHLPEEMSYRFTTKWSPDPVPLVAIAAVEGFTFTLKCEEHSDRIECEYKWDGKILWFRGLPDEFFDYSKHSDGGYETHEGVWIDNIFEYFEESLKDLPWTDCFIQVSVVDLSK